MVRAVVVQDVKRTANQHITELEAEVKGLQLELESCKAEAASVLAQTIAAKDAEVQAVRLEAESMEAALRQQAVLLQDELSAANAQQAQQSAAIAELQQAHVTAAAQISALQAQLASANEAIVSSSALLKGRPGGSAAERLPEHGHDFCKQEIVRLEGLVAVRDSCVMSLELERDNMIAAVFRDAQRTAVKPALPRDIHRISEGTHADLVR